MKVLKAFTGGWESPVFGPFTTTVRETLSIIKSGDLYFVIRETEAFLGGSTIQTEEFENEGDAFDKYDEWFNDLKRLMNI